MTDACPRCDSTLIERVTGTRTARCQSCNYTGHVSRFRDSRPRAPGAPCGPEVGNDNRQLRAYAEGLAAARTYGGKLSDLTAQLRNSEIPHLIPKDDLKLTPAPAGPGLFEDFEARLLRRVSDSFGATFEEVAQSMRGEGPPAHEIVEFCVTRGASPFHDGHEIDQPRQGGKRSFQKWAGRR